VRGTEEAHRHHSQFAPRRGARAQRPRALADDVTKGPSETAQASPARAKGDLGHGQLRVAQERHRPLDAPREQVPVWRNAVCFLEQSREVRRGNAGDACEARDRPGLVRGGVHPILRAQQAAQYPGVRFPRSSGTGAKRPGFDRHGRRLTELEGLRPLFIDMRPGASWSSPFTPDDGSASRSRPGRPDSL
jgi:hypothetical protein